MDSGAHEPDSPYWLAATRAEAELILGDVDRARGLLEEAVSDQPRAWEDHAITLRQFALLLSETGEDSDWLDTLRPPPVLYFGGIMGLAPGDSGAEAEIAEALARIAPGCGYGALAAGTDILCAEGLSRRQADVNLVLPADREEFFRRSVEPAGQDWSDRFAREYERAASVRVVPEADAVDSCSIEMAASLAMGLALSRADQLQTRAVALWVREPAAEASSMQAWSLWREKGHEVVEVFCERTAERRDLRRERAVQTVCVSLASGEEGLRGFADVPAALSEARKLDRCVLDFAAVREGNEPADVAESALRSAPPNGIFATEAAMAVARLHAPDLSSELAGAVRTVAGEVDLYRLWFGQAAV
ncbi:hypothetical protein B5C34_13395 [Pacificimonas flava]|uniref:Uncharacterized protein n=2 Tax=Pacificimonas TaxID=1960290 RepID=A0A219B867_9SPHN|nr:MULTISPECIES: hypothetical protein [Pacificimonas]MBZ6379818.1 hypothetical protein [Pacificimonas aurantium]OWV34353.1 hypothetical protein B5C34_13395 [Pacificimonas flava]